jgi:hypothetical protein
MQIWRNTLEKEDSLVEENYDLFEEVDCFELLQVDNDKFCGLFLWGWDWGRNFVLQLGKVLHRFMKKRGFNSLGSYFLLDCACVVFVLGD